MAYTNYTVAELAQAIDELYEMDAEMSHLRQQIKDRQNDFGNKQNEVIAALELLNIPKAYGSRGGVASVETKESVKVPKEPEARESFFNYLKDQGIFEEMITVHSHTLNAWYNQEVSNQDVGWTVPGIEPGKTYRKLKLVK